MGMNIQIRVDALYRIIICGAIAATALSAHAQGPPLTKPGTEITAGDSTLPDPLFPYEKFKNEALAEKSPLKQTKGCSALEAWEPVVVSEDLWRSIAPISGRPKSNRGVLVVESDVNCIKVGIPALISKLNPATGVTTYLGWFLPTGMAGPRKEFEKQEAALVVGAHLLATKSELVYVSGRVIASLQSKLVGMPTPRMQGAKFITRDQIESAIADGAQIVDVRTKKQFDLAHVKGATHIPYTLGPRSAIGDVYAAFAKNGDAFDVRRVNADREKPVILMGESVATEAVIRAGIVLKSEGWKNIFVFYEGFSFFSGMAASPPVTSNIINVMDTRELAELIATSSSSTLLFDVRSEAEFRESTIAGAQFAAMVERDDLKLRRRGLNGLDLKSYGDTVNVPPEHAKNPKVSPPIVVFGSDSADWRGYKAALILKSLGYPSVSWYRAGAGSWTLRSVESPTRFPVTRSAKLVQ